MGDVLGHVQENNMHAGVDDLRVKRRTDRLAVPLADVRLVLGVPWDPALRYHPD